jgi:hypothetical protein
MSQSDWAELATCPVPVSVLTAQYVTPRQDIATRTTTIFVLFWKKRFISGFIFPYLIFGLPYPVRLDFASERVQ